MTPTGSAITLMASMMSQIASENDLPLTGWNLRRCQHQNITNQINSIHNMNFISIKHYLLQWFTHLKCEWGLFYRLWYFTRFIFIRKTKVTKNRLHRIWICVKLLENPHLDLHLPYIFSHFYSWDLSEKRVKMAQIQIDAAIY